MSDDLTAAVNKIIEKADLLIKMNTPKAFKKEMGDHKPYHNVATDVIMTPFIAAASVGFGLVANKLFPGTGREYDSKAKTEINAPRGLTSDQMGTLYINKNYARASEFVDMSTY